METVSCIAISTGLKAPESDFFIVKQIHSPKEIHNKFNEFANDPLKGVFVIDGDSLGVALQFHEQYFFEITSEAEAVICCRCSPTQKAQVTRKIKIYQDKITLAIGDGGNDVPMIMEADIGVGIEGLEGKQAALASDFSLLKF